MTRIRHQTKTRTLIHTTGRGKWRKEAKTNLSRRHRPTQPMHHHDEEWRP